MKERIPDFQTIMYPVLDFLRDGKSHSFQEVFEFLINKFKLSNEELAILVPSGQQALFKNRVTWAISYLKNAGLLNYVKRAVYQITDTGQSVLKDNITSLNTAI